MTAPLVWRDDDVLQTVNGSLMDLLRVDDLFQSHGVKHTVAVLAYTLTEELAEAIVERGMDAQLHGWFHDNHAQDISACARLGEAADLIEAMVGTRPTVFYPPFNHTSADMEAAAMAHGLTVSARQMSLKDYLDGRHDPSIDVINFHYWAPERELLKDALQRYTGA